MVIATVTCQLSYFVVRTDIGRLGDGTVRDQRGAAFEYVARIELMYDAIFASTNSNCENLEQEADESVVPSWTSM